MRAEPSSLRFLVLGAGSIGRRHARNLRALGVREVAAYDPSPEQRRGIEVEAGVKTFASLADAWAWAPAVALVTSPTRFHLEQATDAFERGCHVFVEKPVAHTLENAERLLKAQGDRIGLVACNLRFHPSLRRMKELLEAGAIGKVLFASARGGQYLPDWHPWEDYRRSYSAHVELGGGAILDFIHEIDYLRWLVGDVRSVTAFADHVSSLEIGTEDLAVIAMRFENGAIGSVQVDYLQRAYRRGAELVGEQGTLLWDHDARAVSLYTAGGGGWTSFPEPAAWDENEMYLDQMRHFFLALRGDVAPAQSIEEGLRAAQIALAAKASAVSGATQQLSSRVGGP